MGAKQTKQVQGQAPRINHSKFSNPKFLRNSEEEQFIQIIVPVVNENQYNQWSKKLKDNNGALLKGQSLMLPTRHEFKKEGMCGASGFVTIDYQNFPFLLCDQIENRYSLNHKQFEETELWYLLYTLISAAKDFHRKGTKVGDIRPSNIFINEDGQVKMASIYSWPGQQTNYSKTYFEKQPTYLSPEQIKDIQFGKSQSLISPQSSQAFAIGLTCLDAALLQNSQPLYSKNGKFDYQRLDDKIKALRSSEYSQLFCLVISNLCETQSEDRCTSFQLHDWLIPHEDAIGNLQDFHVSSLPQKIDRTKNKAIGASVIRQSFPMNHPTHSPSYTESQINSQGQVYEHILYPPQLINKLPPGAKITGPPLTYEQVIAHQRGQNIPGLPVIQMSTQPYPGQNVPPINIPVSASNYIHGVQQKVVYQQMPSPQQILVNEPLTQKVPQSENYGVNQYQNRTYQEPNYQKYRNNNLDGQYNKTLEKIDQQLQQSRRMFPS